MIVNIALSLPMAMAQSPDALRGPISPTGGPQVNDQGPESNSVPVTPDAKINTNADNPDGPIPFVNAPAAPAGALSEPIPTVPTAHGAHTDISIPLDMRSATNGLLLDTTNPTKVPKPPLPLTAVISNVILTTSPQEYLMGDFHGLKVHISNGTDRPLLFNGDKAVIKFDGQCAAPITVGQLQDAVCPASTTKEQIIGVLKVAVTVGLEPTIRDIKMEKGPILQRYGCDEKRREDEQSRFGQRILWPGDSSDGIVYFNTDRSLHGGTLELPISSLADLQDQSTLSGVSKITSTTPLVPISEGTTVAEPEGGPRADKLKLKELDDRFEKIRKQEEPK